MTGTMTLERLGETGFRTQRSFNAPGDMVWRAWTEPEHLVKWWGPRAFQTEVREMDVRPGGVWHYCMRSSEWGDAWGRAVYREVVAPERLSYLDAFSNEEGDMIPPEAETTMTFAEVDGVTTVTGETVYPSVEDVEKVLEMGVEAGMAETLDRLDELLAAGDIA